MDIGNDYNFHSVLDRSVHRFRLPKLFQNRYRINKKSLTNFIRKDVRKITDLGSILDPQKRPKILQKSIQYHLKSFPSSRSLPKPVQDTSRGFQTPLRGLKRDLQRPPKSLLESSKRLPRRFQDIFSSKH